MKVFPSTDMEGTAGVVAWEQCVGDGPEAAAGRRLAASSMHQDRARALIAEAV